MLKNTNKQFISQFAKQSLKKDKLRTILIISTITLATTLSALNMLIANALGVETDKLLENSQHAIYKDITLEQAKALETNENFSETLRYKQGITSEYIDYTITPVYIADGAQEMETFFPYEGSFPTEYNEVLVNKNIESILGKEVNIGDTFEVIFYDGTKETFKISGLSDSKQNTNKQFIHLSKEYAEKGKQLQDIPYSIFARLHNAHSMSPHQFMDTIDSIGENIGIPKHTINPNNNFVKSLSIDINKFMMYAGISTFILLVSAIVIYSIFYISVINRTRELGQLRTIGATNHQIQKIIKKEGFFVSIIGIPIGLILSIVLLFIAKPQGFEFFSVIWVCIFIGIAMFFTVLFSITKPAKNAGKISPIEASKITTEVKNQKVTKILNRNLSPVKLAIIHRKTNKKKFAMTTISLSITGIVFMLGATFISSYSIIKNARQGEHQFNEIILSLSSNKAELNKNGKTGLQLENSFSNEFLEEINKIEGVNTITTVPHIYCNYEYRNLRIDSEISKITKSDLVAYKDYQNDLTVNYEDLITHNGVIIHANDIFKEIFGYNFSIGDKVTLNWFDGTNNKNEVFNVMGLLDTDNTSFMYNDPNSYHTQLTNGWFIIPQEKFDSMMPENFNAISKVYISTDWKNKGQQIVKEIQDLLQNNPNVYISQTLDDRLAMSVNTYDSLKMLLIVVIVFLGMFSIINLFNTLITSVLTRKHEFAIMQSIGLTSKQLKTIIQTEGLLFAFWNILITGIIGGFSGFAMVAISNTLAVSYLDWTFPTWYFIGYTIVVIAIPFVISLALAKNVQKESVIENLRQN